MKPDELDRLLWEEADGTLGVAASERLHALLDSAPDAEARRRQVASCARLLAQVEDVPMPPTLVADIERRVAALPRRRSRDGIVARLLDRLVPRRVELVTAAAAVAVVAGVILALLLAEGGRTQRHDVSRYYGAMTGVAPSGDRGEVVALDHALGTVTIVSMPGSLVCRLQTVAVIEDGVTVHVIGDGVAVQHVEGDSADTASSLAAADSVAVTVPGGGVLTVTVSVPGGTDRVVVQVLAGGRTVAERTVRVERRDDLEE